MANAQSPVVVDLTLSDSDIDLSDSDNTDLSDTDVETLPDVVNTTIKREEQQKLQSDTDSNHISNFCSDSDDELCAEITSGYYNEDCALPVYRWNEPNQHYSITDLAKALIGGNVSKDKVCFKQPVHVCHNVSFVVDVQSLDDPQDIRADENGVWKRKGSPVAYVSLHTSSGKTTVMRRRRMGNHSHHYKITRTYYRHSCSLDFTRIITTVHDYKNNLQSLAFVQYSFDRLAHPIRLPPHGNSKGKKPFSRTKPSTIRLIKSAVESKPPRKAFREIENIKGGVMGAAAGCDLPRDRKQVQNLKYSESHSDLLCKPSTDILAHVMQICKDSAESDSVFVRSVEAAPEPMCILATNQQLKDMERFCTGHPSSVLSIDPTFNLGPFNVTPTTYHHLLVETSRGSNPILLGPILIHQTKTFRPFHYFASTLIRLNPVLANLKAYGTDGEPELIKAFDTCFPRAVHLRCTNHIRQNIKDKLRSLNIPDSVGKDFKADIFGVQVGSHLETGLVDSMSEMSFTKSLQRLKAKWDNLEMSCRAEVPRFYDWFSHYKADEIVKCVLPKVRQQAGQDPSVLFTTNSSESLNHVIKMEVEWKENRLPQLIEKMKSITEDQMSKVESAVVERGEWHFTSQYTDMIIPEIRWFSQMSTNAKKQHLSKVNKLQCPFNAHCLASSLPSHTSRLGAANSDQPSTSILSVSVEEAGLTNIAECTLRSMWAKAEKLVSTEGILKVPWSKDPMSRMVKSSTSDQPHLVTRNPKNVDLFCCDKSCPMFKGFSVCSHVIASAHDNGCLRLFLDQLSGVCRPNLTAIANHGMPTGVGRKGGVAKYKRKRKHPVVETRSVRQCISESHLPPAADTSGSCTSSTPSSHSTQPPANPLDFTSLLSTLHPVCSNTTATATATSQGQVFVGSSIVNLTQGQVSLPTVPSISTAPRSSSSGFSSMRGQLDVTKKPFVLKFKTPLIKICQSCRKNYDGQNDTPGLVLAREERRLASNLATGKQFFGRESNSHYHLRMQCIKAVEPSFEAKEMVIPEEVEQRLNNYQRLYLKMCFQLQ